MVEEYVNQFDCPGKTMVIMWEFDTLHHIFVDYLPITSIPFVVGIKIFSNNDSRKIQGTIHIH